MLRKQRAISPHCVSQGKNIYGPSKQTESCLSIAAIKEVGSRLGIMMWPYNENLAHAERPCVDFPYFSLGKWLATPCPCQELIENILQGKVKLGDLKTSIPHYPQE